MSVQLGNIAASFIYRDDDKPYYHRGNTQLVAINLAALVVFLLTKACKSWDLFLSPLLVQAFAKGASIPKCPNKPLPLQTTYTATSSATAFGTR